MYWAALALMWGGFALGLGGIVVTGSPSYPILGIVLVLVGSAIGFRSVK